MTQTRPQRKPEGCGTHVLGRGMQCGTVGQGSAKVRGARECEGEERGEGGEQASRRRAAGDPMLPAPLARPAAAAFASAAAPTAPTVASAATLAAAWLRAVHMVALRPKSL